MQDPNTQPEQVQPIIDFSTIIPNMPKLENQEIQSPEIIGQQVPTEPQTEKPVNEFVNVDGEMIEVNLDEVIGTNPKDGSPIYLRDTDNPKSYKYFQSVRTKEKNRYETKLKELEEKLNTVQKPEVKPEVKLEPPKVPPKPIRPKDYDETEAITNPESLSGQFLMQDREYKDAVIERLLYDNDQLKSFKGQIETERTTQLKSQEELAKQAYWLGQIQQVGGVDMNEAKEIWETYSTPKDDVAYLKEVIDFHHFKKGQRTPQAQQQIAQFDKNTQRQSQYLPPPGVIGTQSQVETPTLGDALMETVKKYRI